MSKLHGHITRYNYMKIDEIDRRNVKDGRNRTFNINRMIWDRDIYNKNESQLEVILDKTGYKIEKLKYDDYLLFFIREKRDNPIRNNVFWVNTLSKGTFYDNHMDESIMIYKMGEWNNGEKIKFNGQEFTAIHVGNAFTRYNVKTSKNENQFWVDFKNAIQSIRKKHQFLYSVFGKYIIVYKYID